MWEYIVMGQIPGTRFEVNFNTWLLFVGTPLGLWALYRLSRSIWQAFVVARQSERIAALRISYIIQTAAYLRLLTGRQHMQV